MSNRPLTRSKFRVENSVGESILSGKLSLDLGAFQNFPHHYLADFSKVIDPGKYIIHSAESSSPPFQISSSIYKPLTRGILSFLHVQRCGNTDPLLHDPCHLADASKIVGGPNSGTALELQGGWHDAGDYIKFLLTTSHTVYMLLMTYEINPTLFTDKNDNGLSDLLDEAKVGIDWMMKMHYRQNGLLVQVQDLTDHTVGWRMPEDDPLTYIRPAYFAPSKAYCGSYSAAMALAGSIFRRVGDVAYADECLRHAQEVYGYSKSDIPDYATGPDSMYYDKICWDNLALAAVELYRTTGKKKYLREAINLVETNETIYWCSWSDLCGLAYARLIPYHKESADRLIDMLGEFSARAQQNPFGYPLTSYPWGSLLAQTGVGYCAILHQYYTGSSQYIKLAEQQRDFILGNNHHGVSFISGFGTEYPHHLHNQIPFMTKLPLMGAVAGGYVSSQIHRKQNIQLERDDRFALLQADESVYHDDRNDYLCNEPTISNNAQALFLYSWFSR